MIIVGNGYPVYGMWFDPGPGFGYHVDKTRGIATGTVDPECIPPLDSPRRISLSDSGNDPESIYAVMSGKHYNGGCCFDYDGNSETDDTDDDCGTMEAIYFGNAHARGNSGAGEKGPWVGAQLYAVGRL